MQDFIKELLDLTILGETNKILQKLKTAPTPIKGQLFEEYLCILYKGSGWLAVRKGGKNDSGADIVLYHPKNPLKSELIIQAKNQERTLSYDDTKIELIKFEEEAANKFGCKQFCIISISGFVAKAKSLQHFNLLLNDSEFVCELIKKYNPESNPVPMIPLFAHNQITFDKVEELRKISNKIAVVQATGTGKSFLIAKVMSQFYSKSTLLLAPSNFILNQFNESFPWLAKNSTRMTYSALMYSLKNGPIIDKYDLIILDEFHRIGADEWGKGVGKLLEGNHSALTFGVSATPIRYLDDSRDMSDELFAKNEAENLSLAEAIVRKILPMPEYVTSLYSLEEEIVRLNLDIDSSFLTSFEKKEEKEKLKKIGVDWEKANGVPQILRKYFKPTMSKFIIFCKDKKHLQDMELVVQKWFLELNRDLKRKPYTILSGDPDNKRTLSDFKSANKKNTVHLLFCIDMLNEGLHISDVHGVILLRPTESPIIFYQQIGRCIQSNSQMTPIIFDFVNNFKNIRAQTFLDDINSAKRKEDEVRSKHGLSLSNVLFTIHDESQNINLLLNEIENNLAGWDIRYNQLIEYKKKCGNCNIPSTYPPNPSLGSWVVTQRSHKNKLSPERVKKLDALGFTWDLIATAWENKFNELKAFKTTSGHCNVPDNYSDNPSLGLWVGTQRSKKNKLSSNQIERLEALGFVWDMRSYNWEKMFIELEQFKKIEGHCNVPDDYRKNPELGIWVSGQRSKRKILSKAKLDRLIALGFDWDPRSSSWEKMFKELENFKQSEGHCNVPDNYPKNLKLSTWIAEQRFCFKSKRMNSDKLKRLCDIGFVWDVRSSNWDKMFIELEQYKKIEGHCNVPKDYSENLALGIWVDSQRSGKKKLSQDRLKKLDTLGFDWDPRNTLWEKMFLQLKEFKMKKGHCNVPDDYLENSKLGTWVGVQRRRKNTLSLDRLEKLNKLGFDWDPRLNAWENKYNELVAFKKCYSHCNIPQSDARNPELGIWVASQRSQKSKLSLEQVAKLNKLGFGWTPLANVWEKMFKELENFKQKEGHCNVPQKYSKNPALGGWVSRLRSNQRKLTASQMKKLNDLGFDWVPNINVWDDMFFELYKFKKTEGHCNVPAKYKKNPKLSVWVSSQRGKKEKLTPKQLQKLNDIGFVWDMRSFNWEEKFKELLKFQKINGHCNIPTKYPQNPKLRCWVNEQRAYLKQNTMTSERRKKLKEIGFK